MSSFKRNSLHLCLTWVVVGVLGAVEGLYGRTQYLGDWISYLNVSKAVSSHDWRGIFDPMWAPGYPALVALARGMAPRGAEGEWYAITALNWVIFLATYATVLYLVRQIGAFHEESDAGGLQRPMVTWVVCLLFLSYELCFDNVSRVAPDLLVSLLFLLGVSQTLRVLGHPSGRGALILGLILGLGCWSKNIFSFYAAAFLLVLVLARSTERIPMRVLAITTAAFLALFVPFVSGMSWSYGQFTLGASGELNYAFHVNHLPHWTNWQGGPPQFGRPLHASTKLLSDLPVFAFRDPFKTTYPPYNNIAYWYQGFRHFFSARNQIVAAERAMFLGMKIAKGNQIIYALFAVLVGIVLKPSWRTVGLRCTRRFWPLVLLPALAAAPYMLVHVEPRYLGGILLVLSLAPLTLVLDPMLQRKQAFLAFVLAAYLAGAVAELKTYDGWTIQAALHHQDFHQDPQWKLANALLTNGLRPGDTVAVIGHEHVTFRCSWAYVAGIRIVAEFGSLPWSIEPTYRTAFDHPGAEPADEDAGDVFWQLPRKQRERVLQAFQSVGVQAILSLAQPTDPADTRWARVGDTGAWIFRNGSERDGSPVSTVLTR